MRRSFFRVPVRYSAMLITAAIAIAVTNVAFRAAQPRATAARVVEIRSYNLKPGTRARFHERFERESMPLLRDAKVDVVAYGPSLHDADSWFLLRAYASVADRQQSEDAFYGSDAWRNGPREATLADIESYTTVVVPLDDPTVQGLRALTRK
jgi:hypothetical protein